MRTSVEYFNFITGFEHVFPRSKARSPYETNQDIKLSRCQDMFILLRGGPRAAATCFVIIVNGCNIYIYIYIYICIYINIYMLYYIYYIYYVHYIYVIINILYI